MEQVTHENKPPFKFQNGQVVCENILISSKYRRLLKFFLEFEKGRSSEKIDQYLNLKMDGSSMK
jgi:hypothetical protein